MTVTLVAVAVNALTTGTAGWYQIVGTRIATVGGDDRTVRIWDPIAGQRCALMRVERSLEDCAWSPSGDSLAVAGEAGLYLFTFRS